MKLKKAAAYIGYSSDNQSISMEDQLKAIEDYAKENNMYIVKIYTDEIEPNSTERFKFEEMINDSKINLFDAVITHKRKTFAFNLHDFLIYLNLLKIYNVKLICVIDDLYENNPELAILDSFYELLVKNTSYEAKKFLMFS